MTGPYPPPAPPQVPREAQKRRKTGCLPAALILIVFMLVAGAFLGMRYVPLVDDVQAVRVTANRLSVHAKRLEPSMMDRAAIAELGVDMQELDDQLEPLRAATGDPLVRLASVIPLMGPQVAAGVSLIDAADALVEAGHLGLRLADEVVALREANEADDSFELTTALVELISDSTADVDRIGDLVARADSYLAEIPSDALGPIREARDLVAEPLTTYGPLLEQYREFDEVLPDLIGFGEEKTYLVLAQNPAELRPAGGYAGTIGTIKLRDGKLIEQRFQNVYDLDLQKDLPFVEPPDELTQHLLAPDAEGNAQSWRLADAAWSPDFPTAAQKAAEFYGIEADGAQVDGVIAITTYALDRLLEVVGSVDVPMYDVVVKPGDVTLTLLGATRGTPTSLEGRKDVLDALARKVTQRLLALPSDKWLSAVDALQQIGDERMAMVWLADETAQRAMVDIGWAGPVRQDEGDYLYVVESNVAPTSKYNLVVDRADSLVVKLDENGDALDSLRLDWQNDAGKSGEPYRSLRSFSNNEAGWYGSYLRILAPADSELLTANGKTDDRIRGVERIEEEAGRAVYANYLLMPPGESTMSYLWLVPGAAVATDEGWEYRLLIQKQPGARSVPVSVRIDLPPGAVVTDATEGVVVDGERARFETDLTSDVELRVLYELAGDESP